MPNVHWSVRSLLGAALFGALCSCSTVQQRDRSDVRRGAIQPAARQPRMPDGIIPIGAVADTFNTGRPPATGPRDPTRRTMGLRRADDATSRVDSIVVKPGELLLKVGDTLSLRGKGAVTWVAKDSSRHTVNDFYPAFSSSDSSVAFVQRLRLTALRKGECELLVSAVVSDSATRRPRVLRTTRVKVTVK